MILTSIIAGKFAVSKIAGISLITSTLSDVITGSITYHYWDKKKRKKFTIKKRKKRW